MAQKYRDININGVDDQLRRRLNRMRKALGYPTMSGFLKVTLTRIVDDYEKNLDKMSRIWKNDERRH